jgi:transcriptional regulator of acetoin/glycerol metabolism
MTVLAKPAGPSARATNTSAMPPAPRGASRRYLPMCALPGAAMLASDAITRDLPLGCLVASSDGTRLLSDAPTTLSLPAVRLVVLRGPDRGRARALEHEELVVGTASACQLQLTDPTVSRSHFALRAGPRGLTVTDLGSTNGTRVDKRRVESVYVEPGDVIEAGATRLRLEAVRGRLDLELSRFERFGPLLGKSVAARRLFALLEHVARTELTVLLLGESGVGKDLAAGALHEASERASGPFVVFDCGAAAPSLIESELFGHERGAFTGATEKRLGAFQEAAGGTLFLDEIGELPRELQPKLLRAIDQRSVRPLGADRPVTVDVRIVAATNRDLALEVNRGGFREDLYYRLSAFPVRVPPLRERLDDLPLLADHFWRGFSKDSEGGLPAELLPVLLEHAWPGNVRELRHRVEQLVVLRRHAPAEPASSAESYRTAKARAVDGFEIAFLTQLMARAGGNVSEASRLADMDRPFLAKLLRKHRISRK